MWGCVGFCACSSSFFLPFPPFFPPLSSFPDDRTNDEQRRDHTQRRLNDAPPSSLPPPSSFNIGGCREGGGRREETSAWSLPPLLLSPSHIPPVVRCYYSASERPFAIKAEGYSQQRATHGLRTGGASVVSGGARLQWPFPHTQHVLVTCTNKHKSYETHTSHFIFYGLQQPATTFNDLWLLEANWGVGARGCIRDKTCIGARWLVLLSVVVLWYYSK